MECSKIDEKDADTKSTTNVLLELIVTYGPPKEVNELGTKTKSGDNRYSMIAPYTLQKVKSGPMFYLQVLHCMHITRPYIPYIPFNGMQVLGTPFYIVYDSYELISFFDIENIPSNLNRFTIIEIQKVSSIRDKLPNILQKAFDKQKSHGDRGKIQQDFYAGEKVLVKIN